jgi:hypothetical protein
VAAAVLPALHPQMNIQRVKLGVLGEVSVVQGVINVAARVE